MSSKITTNQNELKTSKRASNIASFKVMDVLQRANEIQTQEGRKVFHCEVGQPGTGAPKGVTEEAIKVLSASSNKEDREVLGYTDAFGLIALREKIAQHYRTKYENNGVMEEDRLNVENIVITTGSSGGFLLVFNGCFDVGDVVALASSGYPCYRNISQALGIEIATIGVNAEFKLTAKELELEVERRREVGEKDISGLILSSPSNPTGAMLSPSELQDLCTVCDQHKIQFISDEIYHGISYGKPEATALSCSSSAIVINSFSKYYSMSGWRLGWMVIPSNLVDVMNKLQQNMFISSPTISQRAALKCWEDETIQELEGHVLQYKLSRDLILNKLSSIPSLPSTQIAPADGGFYIYIDLGDENIIASKFDSVTLCSMLLEEEGVAFTPGVDFEDPLSGLGRRRFRISYAAGVDVVREAMERFYRFWEMVWLPMISNSRGI